jgi:uncharacterized protein involved in exopolysaccharide biosynthesis
MAQVRDVFPVYRILLLIRRHWAMALICWSLPVGIAALSSLATTPLYRSESSIEVRPETSSMSTSIEDRLFGASQSMWDTYYQTQKELILSPEVLDAAIRNLPEPLKKNFLASPAPHRKLAGHVQIETTRKTFMLNVSCVAENPANAQHLTQAMVAAYVDSSKNWLRQVKERAARSFSDQTLPEIRKKIAETEKKLDDFQAAIGYVNLENEFASLLESRRRVHQRLLEIRLARARVKSEIDALRKFRQGGTSGMYHPRLSSNRQLEQLGNTRARILEEIGRESQDLKDTHPRIQELKAQLETVDRSIDEVIEGNLAGLDSELVAGQEEEADVNREGEAVARKLEQVGNQLQTFRKLLSEVTAANDLLRSYQKNYTEALITIGSEPTNLRVVKPANLPLDPFSPDLRRDLTMGGIVGLALSLGLLVVVDQFRKKVLSLGEIESLLGLQILGEVTHARGSGANGPELEALRAQVQLRMGRIAGRALAVIGSSPGDGTADLAEQLAAVLAGNARRVLLIQACAEGDSQIHPGAVTGLDLVKPDPSAGRAGLWVQQEIARWKMPDSPYAMILVDTGPLLGQPDAIAIAAACDAALLVLRVGHSGIHRAQETCRNVMEFQKHLLGAAVHSA